MEKRHGLSLASEAKKTMSKQLAKTDTPGKITLRENSWLAKMQVEAFDLQVVVLPDFRFKFCQKFFIFWQIAVI
jgi:hypothetical protein